MSSNRIFMLIFFFLVSVNCMGQKKAQRKMQKLIDANFALAASQYKLLAKNTDASLMPRSFDSATGKLITSKTTWWTSGFFPGSLWYIYEYTKDTAIRSEAERRLAILEKEKYQTYDHDIGFMIFCSFGNAYRITGTAAYKEVILTAAESQIKRYRPSIKSIQSWDSSKNFRCPVIIDNMMNLELLNWAADAAREPKYKAVSITHANTTLKNHFRADNSSYHVLDYDLATGNVRAKKTAQGAFDESAWARGQSWGLYGFTMMYRFTKEPVYLEQAKKIASFLLHHPNLPADKVPYWDYNAKDIPGAYRDVSAASILASALLELGFYADKKEKEEYEAVAKTILQSLSSNTYRNKPGEMGGFLLKHSVGSLPGKSEVDVPLTYADYYFLEALMRYQQWYIAGKK
jgi:unsaturated chondroitin disaccharide hydrolase